MITLKVLPAGILFLGYAPSSTGHCFLLASSAAALPDIGVLILNYFSYFTGIAGAPDATARLASSAISLVIVSILFWLIYLVIWGARAMLKAEEAEQERWQQVLLERYQQKKSGEGRTAE